MIPRILMRLEARIITNKGRLTRSSSGTQQGSCLWNPPFVLTMQHIVGLLDNIKELRTHIFFEDTALVGTPKSLDTAELIIQ